MQTSVRISFLLHIESCCGRIKDPDRNSRGNFTSLRFAVFGVEVQLNFPARPLFGRVNHAGIERP